MSSWQENAYRRQKARRDLSLYKKYIGQTGTAAFALPGDIDLFVRAPAGCAQDALALTANSRNLHSRALTPGGVHWVGRFAKATVVTIQAGFELCVDTGLGNYKQIGPV